MVQSKHDFLALEMIETRQVRLCVAAETFQAAYGGGALRFRRYLPGLAARGLEVLVFSGTPTGLKARLAGVPMTWSNVAIGELLAPDQLDGFPTHTVRLPDVKSTRRQLHFFRALVRFCRSPEYRPHVVQLLTPPLSGIPWAIQLRRLGIATVLAKTMVAEPPRSAVRGLARRVYLRAQTAVIDSLVASTASMERSLRDVGAAGRITVIPNGVDTDRFRPAATQIERVMLRDRLGLPSGAPIILFVGVINPRKGIDLLLEAWARFAAERTDALLVVVGPRADQENPLHQEFRRSLVDLLNSIGEDRANRIRFMGVVDNVEDYMRAADVFVFASRREGMPNVVLEAMASGLPVVMTRFLGLSAEFGVPGRDFLLSDRTPENLSAHISSLIRDDTLRETVGRSARQWVLDRLSLDKALDAYASLYHQLASSYRRGRFGGAIKYQGAFDGEERAK